MDKQSDPPEVLRAIFSEYHYEISDKEEEE